MKRLYLFAAAYAALGLAGGLYYRTLTHSLGYTEPTQLSLVHTHFLALGMLATLIFLALEKVFGFLGSRAARVFEIAYHSGVIVTAAMLAINGTLAVLGVQTNPKMMAGISGTGHILLTIGVAALFVALWQALRPQFATTEGPTTR